MEAEVRPARAGDRAPLMSFIKDVWGGHDYIPRVWDEWLSDKSGRMFVVEVDGVPVGMNRIRFIEDGSVWFEGARVHPDFRGRGLATMLGENSIAVARRRGATRYRLTSGSTNKTAHRQIAKIGFAETARFTVYGPPKGRTPRPAPGAERMERGEESDAIRLMRRSKEFHLGTGVFWHDWAAASLSSDVVRRLVREGSVWRLGDAVAVAREGSEGKGRWEEVCFVGGPPGEALRLVKSLIGRIRGASARWVFLPQRSPLIHELRQKGYRRTFAMIMFERRAVKG